MSEDQIGPVVESSLLCDETTRPAHTFLALHSPPLTGWFGLPFLLFDVVGRLKDVDRVWGEHTG